MTYEKAVAYLLDKYGSDVLNNGFQVRAILSDYVGSNICDSRLVDCFCWLNENIGLLRISKNSDLNTYRRVIVSYCNSKKKLEFDKEEVKNTVNPITAVLFKEEYEAWVSKKKVAPVKKCEKKKPQNKTPQQNILGYFHSLDIKCEKNIYELTIREGSEFKITDKGKLDLSKYIAVKNNCASIDLTKQKGDITIYVPKDLNIKSVNIRAKTDLYINSNKRIKNTTIINDGNILWSGDCKNLKIRTSRGANIISTNIENIDVKAVRNIEYCLCASVNKVQLRLYSQYGEIKGSFLDGKSRPRVIPIFARTRRVRTKSYIKNTLINYDLYAPRGKVIAK